MGNRHYIIPIFVPNEGCLHNCVFCDQKKITGNEEKVDAAFTRNTINTYLDTIKNREACIEVSFFGGTFTAIDIQKQIELLKVAKQYKDRGLIDFIHLSTRPDYIDAPILDNLKYYGVDVIELGVQSLDKEVLLKSGRGHSEEDVRKASLLIKKYGFILGHQIMLGLPGDKFDKDITTVKKSIDMEPDIYRIYPALIIKGTPMEYMYNKGIYNPYSLYDAVYISKILYCMLVSEGINVIRIGLQPTEEINLGAEVVGGPFHPAFKELVFGSLYSEMLQSIVPEGYSDLVKIRINPRDVSRLYADGKKFFKNMKSNLRLSSIPVIQDESIERESLKLVLGEKESTIFLKNYMDEVRNKLKECKI
ncbi:elongator complex protein 3 [Clostridium sp. LBM24168]